MNQFGTTHTDVKAFDKDYQIIFSDNFIIYNNQLVLKNLGGLTFEFNFIKDSTKDGSPLDMKHDKEKNLFQMNLYNFDNPLGVGMTNPLEILTLNQADNKEASQKIYLSIIAKSFNPTISLLQVAVNFYLK